MSMDTLAYHVEVEKPISATVHFDLSNPDKAYKDTERLVLYLVNAFHFKYGGCKEELLSEANWHWMYAWKIFDPKRGKFHKTVQFVVWHGLENSFYKQQKKNKKEPHKFTNYIDQVGQNYVPTIKQKYVFNSRKVNDIIDIIIDDKLDILKYARMRKSIPQLRDSFIEFLRSMDWSYEQIAEVVEEIRESLH